MYPCLPPPINEKNMFSLESGTETSLFNENIFHFYWSDDSNVSLASQEKKVFCFLFFHLISHFIDTTD